MARMLIVDDDPAWQALYRMAFDDRFEIFEAMDGHQGLALLDLVNPDVILLDLRMPKIDGLDFIRRVDLRGDHPPIIVCSGAWRDGERPSIPGIPLTAKTADLRDLCAALRSAVPKISEDSALGSQTPMELEHTTWRD